MILQNTNSFETYTLHSRELGQKLSFSPRPAIKIGPYLGWRWIFLGYTFEVSSLGKGQQSKKCRFGNDDFVARIQTGQKGEQHGLRTS